jgi:hypothetical protein
LRRARAIVRVTCEYPRMSALGIPTNRANQNFQVGEKK